jgi:hypothetical protein
MRRLPFRCSPRSCLRLPTATAKDETVDELKARFESARAEDRAELGIRIAHHQLRNADKLYNDGKIDQARAAVDDIVTYSEKARDAATQTKKRLKNVEIDVRKMAEKLRDIKRTLAFEDQPRSNRPSIASKTFAPPCSTKCSPKTRRRERNEAMKLRGQRWRTVLGRGLLLALPLLSRLAFGSAWAQRVATRSIRWRSTSSAMPCSIPRSA